MEHGTDGPTWREVRETGVRQKLEQIYNRWAHYSAAEREHLYNTPEQHLVKHTLGAVEQWLVLFQDAFWANAHRAQAVATRVTKLLTAYFQKIIPCWLAIEGAG